MKLPCAASLLERKKERKEEEKNKKMSSLMYRSASRVLTRVVFSGGLRHACRGADCRRSTFLDAYSGSQNASSDYNMRRRISGSFLAVPIAAYMLQEQQVHADADGHHRHDDCTIFDGQMERSFIAIKPDGVQRGLMAEIVARFERKGYKLVAIKLLTPSKELAEKHYHDLREKPFFDGLCNFLSSGPVLAMVWEGEGVIKYGRKLVGSTDPQKSEPGTIRGDFGVVVGRNIIHGSDGPETAKDEIALWFKYEELVSYSSNNEKWVYGVD